MEGKASPSKPREGLTASELFVAKLIFAPIGSAPRLERAAAKPRKDEGADERPTLAKLPEGQKHEWELKEEMRGHVDVVRKGERGLIGSSRKGLPSGHPAVKVHKESIIPSLEYILKHGHLDEFYSYYMDPLTGGLLIRGSRSRELSTAYSGMPEERFTEVQNALVFAHSPGTNLARVNAAIGLARQALKGQLDLLQTAVVEDPLKKG